MKRILVDANIFLRLFVGDVPSEQKKSKILIERAKKGKYFLFIPQIVVFEINFALVKYYGFEKIRVIEALESILTSKYFDVESKSEFLEAIKIYRSNNFDLTDCFLISISLKNDIELVTYDKKLSILSKSYGQNTSTD